MVEIQAKAIQGNDRRQEGLNTSLRPELKQYLVAVDGYKDFLKTRCGGGSSTERNG